jgi:hypothetical protein
VSSPHSMLHFLTISLTLCLQEYEEDRRRRTGVADPTRVKFRKLATA